MIRHLYNENTPKNIRVKHYGVMYHSVNRVSTDVHYDYSYNITVILVVLPIDKLRISAILYSSKTSLESEETRRINV